MFGFNNNWYNMYLQNPYNYNYNCYYPQQNQQQRQNHFQQTQNQTSGNVGGAIPYYNYFFGNSTSPTNNQNYTKQINNNKQTNTNTNTKPQYNNYSFPFYPNYFNNNVTNINSTINNENPKFIQNALQAPKFSLIVNYSDADLVRIERQCINQIEDFNNQLCKYQEEITSKFSNLSNQEFSNFNIYGNGSNLYGNYSTRKDELYRLSKTLSNAENYYNTYLPWANHLKSKNKLELSNRLDALIKDTKGAIQIYNQMLQDTSKNFANLINIQNQTNKESFNIWKETNDKSQKTFDRINEQFSDYIRGEGPRHFCCFCGCRFNSGYYDSNSYCPSCGKKQS